MKYWRKMLLAVFAVCLFAGMASSVAFAAMCNEPCKDGLIFIGDKYYPQWPCCPCDDGSRWPLGSRIFDCEEEGLWDQGDTWIIPQAIGEVGMMPHTMAWNEEDHVVFVSYLGSPSISIIDLDEPVGQYNVKTTTFNLPFVDHWVGAMVFDEATKKLYVADMKWNDAIIRVFLFDPDRCCLTELTEERFSVCCETCGANELFDGWNFLNVDMALVDGNMYVTYATVDFTCSYTVFNKLTHETITYEHGDLPPAVGRQHLCLKEIRFTIEAYLGNPYVGIFDVEKAAAAYRNPEDGITYECESFPVKCTTSCGVDNLYFPASSIAVTKVDTEKCEDQVLAFTTYHGWVGYVKEVIERICMPRIEMDLVDSGIAAEEFVDTKSGGGKKKPKLVVEFAGPDLPMCPTGVLAMTNVDKALDGDLDATMFWNANLVERDGFRCDEWIDLRALDINPCSCGCNGDCSDGVVYLTAMRYEREADHFGLWLECLIDHVVGCLNHRFDSNCFNFEVELPDFLRDILHAKEQNGMVLAINYGVDDCGAPDEINISTWDELGLNENGWPWSPAGIKATQWVRENVLEAEEYTSVTPVVPAVGDIAFKFSYTHQGEGQSGLPFRVKWDESLLVFAGEWEIVKGTEAEKTAPLQASEEGNYLWDNILDPFQDDWIAEGETITLVMEFNILGDGSGTMMGICGDFAGYECFDVTVGGGTPPPNCCDIIGGMLLGVDTDPVAPGVGNYSGDKWIFQVICENGESDGLESEAVDSVKLFFEDEMTAEDWMLAKWTGTEWEDVADDVLTAGEDPEDGYYLEITGVTFECEDIFALVEAGDTVLSDMNDDGGGGGGSEEPVTTSSSGCNVGFSAAALLFAVPLVSIFRKR